jgi:hypothetical protein
MAKEAGVSHATIQRDVDIILSRWRESQNQTANVWVTLQLERLGEIIAALWPHVVGLPIKDPETGALAPRDIDPALIDRFHKAVEQQARYLGIVAGSSPVLRLAGADGGPLQLAGVGGGPVQFAGNMGVSVEDAGSIFDILAAAGAIPAATSDPQDQ